MTRGPIRGALALICASLAAGCGTRAATTGTTAPPPVTVPLATSLVTAQGTWAIAVMGGPAATHSDFWQLFVRPAGASRWSLATRAGCDPQPAIRPAPQTATAALVSARITGGPAPAGRTG